MRIHMKVNMQTTFEVEILGEWQPPTPDSRGCDGVYQPGNGATIECMRVFLTRGAKRLDITGLLSDTKLRELEEDAIDLNVAYNAP
jgi:hypothetical protein